MPQNQLHSNLLKWFEANSRDLPWRKTKDPYLVWLSEIILQQTRVNQGLPYYEAFAENYPTVGHLAHANEGEVLKLWQGLGYYSRARNMLKTAQIVHRDFDSIFPKTRKELLKLPGIGPYTAAAILSFCFGQAEAVLDGNVFRVISRMSGISVPINSSKGQKVFANVAQEFINSSRSGDHNQAMMELGSMVCTPTKPKCDDCPFSGSCVALKENLIAFLPVKLSANKKRLRHFNYLVSQPKNSSIYINKRTETDIWKHLFEFPQVETTEAVNSFADIRSSFETNLQLTIPLEAICVKSVHSYVLSHQQIHATFWYLDNTRVIPGENCDIFEVQLEDIEERYAVPVLIKNYLSKLKTSTDVD